MTHGGPPCANQHLIGVHDARARISTPALMLDLDRLEANIAAMAAFSRQAGVQVRPHVKCHKSIAIARRQLDAGAVGVCCATISEAEIMGRGGIHNILITSPLTTPEKIRRFCDLSHRLEWLAVAVDHPANVSELAAAARSSGQTLRVVVDIDPGMRRTGVACVEAGVQLALACVAAESLGFEGVQCYAGLAQHERSYANRCQMVQAMFANMRAVCAELRHLSHGPRIASGGGTGTFAIDAELGMLNELQVGSYVFMDVKYQAVRRWLHAACMTAPLSCMRETSTEW